MRPDLDQYFMAFAMVAATRATCLRRRVGCALVDARGHLLATGYNGVAVGRPHCNAHDAFHETGYPHACDAATAGSGNNLDGCEAIHAEQNALLQCRDVYAIKTAYVTTLPCVPCAKLLLATSCERIVFGLSYPQEAAVRALWCGAVSRLSTPRELVQIDVERARAVLDLAS